MSGSATIWHAQRDALVLQHAEQALRHGSRSFALATRLLEPRLRDSVTMLYAWCRHCDDLIDGQFMGFARRVAQPSAQQRLLALRERTHRVLGGQSHDAGDVAGAALARVLQRHSISPELPLEHLNGYAMDVEGVRYDSLAELLLYCWRVAGVVGVMMAHIMGARDARLLDRACDLGLAFQLTNIARDVIDDARVDRVYLPRTWLREAGIALPTDQPGADARLVLDPRNRAAVVLATARLLDAAEPYYESARIGLRALSPRSAWAIATALHAYRAIGVGVRARGAQAWQARVATGRLRKVAFALQGAGAALQAIDSPYQSMALANRTEDRAGLWTRPFR